jgi:hypothetical protein
MDSSRLDESTLTWGDNVVHLWAEPPSHGFSNDLRDHVDEADGTEVRDRFRTVLLWQEHDVGIVDDVKIRCQQLGEGTDDSHKVGLDHIPTGAI